MRFALRLLALAAALTALAVAGAYLTLRQSLPQTEGEIRLAGPGAPVEILRDAYGIPHVFARSRRRRAATCSRSPGLRLPRTT